MDSDSVSGPYIVINIYEKRKEKSKELEVKSKKIKGKKQKRKKKWQVKSKKNNMTTIVIGLRIDEDMKL